MFYQLPNGRVIEISTEQYFEMTDEELEYLIAYNYGEPLENPWFGSILNNHVGTPDVISEDLSDLTSATEIEKLLDLDVDSKEED